MASQAGDSTTIYALRHGESTFNRARRWQGRCVEPPLTELGEQQAAAAADLLTEVDFDAVITSHLVRANQTGTIIAKKLGIVKVEKLEDLQERDVGIYQGMKFEEIKKLGVKSRSENNPGWEADGAVEARLVDAMKEISKRYPGKTVLVVSHGGSLSLLSRSLGVDEKGISNLQGRVYLCNNKTQELFVGERLPAPQLDGAGPVIRKSTSTPVIY